MKKPVLACSSVMLFSLLVACGPSVSGGRGDDDDGDGDGDGDGISEVDASTPTTCVPQPEICNNNADEDCDDLVDCDDADCEATCANCGMIEHPEASPLALPDGVGVYYNSSISFSQFGATQSLQNINHLLGVCVNMEHSWLRDLEISLTCPGGQRIVMHNFGGRMGGEVYLGNANDSDSASNPVPGTGMEYCWSPTAINPTMLEYANNPANSGNLHPLPPGDYRSFDNMQQLLGCPLNGTWTLTVKDDWGIDNGFIFSWGLKFDPDIVEDCANWPPIG